MLKPLPHPESIRWNIAQWVHVAFENGHHGNITLPWWFWVIHQYNFEPLWLLHTEFKERILWCHGIPFYLLTRTIWNFINLITIATVEAESDSLSTIYVTVLLQESSQTITVTYFSQIRITDCQPSPHQPVLIVQISTLNSLEAPIRERLHWSYMHAIAINVEEFSFRLFLSCSSHTSLA